MWRRNIRIKAITLRAFAPSREPIQPPHAWKAEDLISREGAKARRRKDGEAPSKKPRKSQEVDPFVPNEVEGCLARRCLDCARHKPSFPRRREPEASAANPSPDFADVTYQELDSRLRGNDEECETCSAQNHQSLQIKKPSPASKAKQSRDCSAGVELGGKLGFCLTRVRTFLGAVRASQKCPMTLDHLRVSPILLVYSTS
jgi:hypothetical protein